MKKSNGDEADNFAEMFIKVASTVFNAVDKYVCFCISFTSVKESHELCTSVIRTHDMCHKSPVVLEDMR